jgi:subtilase family serine protease
MLADSYTGEGIGFTTANGYIEYASGGTSLASPLLAGLTADAQQKQGIAREGFLNPAIYAQAGKAALTDVTPHATGIWTPEMAGFGAVPVPTDIGSYLIDNDAKPQSIQSGPGYDLVTGVGTPNAAFLSALGQ